MINIFSMFIAELTVQRLHTMCPRGRGRRLWSGLLSLMLWLPTGLLGCAARRMNDHLRPLGIRLLTFRVSKCFVMQFIVAFIEFLLCHWQRNFVRWDDFDPRLSPFERILLDWLEKRGFCLIIVLCVTIEVVIPLKVSSGLRDPESMAIW